MNRNIRQTLLAPAVLLLAVTLGLAGCTQGEDALQGADGNNGARTLNINVGPKQGFISGFTSGDNADSNADGSAYSNDPATRSTVNEDTGAMAWEEGDRIFLYVAYTGASAKSYTLVRNAASAWDFYEGYVGTHDKDGNAVNLSDLTSFSGIPVPMGATAITQIIAYHTDNDTRPYYDRMVLMEGGSCDQLRQVISNPDMNAGITLALTHADVARLYFPGGLTPGKKYYPGGLQSIEAMFINQTGATSTSSNFSFTAAPDGSLAICLGGSNATGSQTVTLKEKDDDADDTNDKVVYTATFNVAVGSSYRCIIPAAGGVDPDSRPNLLIPDPIVPGNKVYAVNGYFVTAPDADESREYQWAANADATQMDSDPCAGHGNWRMPTMKDFEKMAGWAASNRWSQEGANTIVANIGSDTGAWNTAFPDGGYWSSVARTSSSSAWNMYSYGNGIANYTVDRKTYSLRVRCVQPQ